MGAFVANFHVRSEVPAAIEQAMPVIGASQFRVSRPHNGWVSVHEQRASTQDETWIERVAVELSARLGAACVAFMLHDSDVARYWLADHGQLLDEYNSIPDYFDDVSPAERRRVRGQADVFVRYCKPSVTVEQIEAVLRADVVFADDTVRQLAEFLDIDPDRALEDFRDRGPGAAGASVPVHGDDDDGDDSDDDGLPGGSMPSGGGMSNLMQAMQRQVASMFVSTEDQSMSPQSHELVDAAASGNIAEIDRLVETGTNVNAPGLLPLEPFGGSSLLAGSGLAPKIPISPLMAAASRGQTAALKRLLERGANLNEVHPLYASALHVAAQSGSAETVRILLEAGIPADVKNRHGHTPRAALQAVRSQIEAAKTWAKSMPQIRPVYDQLLAKLEAANLSGAGWNACEELLQQAGG